MVRDPKAAVELLDDLQAVLVRSHHRRLLIDVLGLKAVIAEANGDLDTASDLLQEAVRIGQPGQLIRPLANLGPGITTLLDRLELGREGRQYVDKILSVRTESDRLAADSTAFPASLDMLSRRELQILELFARNLSNKEIAHRLCISSGTVKRHAHNIYGKLDVTNRHKAVAKATSLGLLQKAANPAP